MQLQNQSSLLACIASDESLRLSGYGPRIYRPKRARSRRAAVCKGRQTGRGRDRGKLMQFTPDADFDTLSLSGCAPDELAA